MSIEENVGFLPDWVGQVKGVREREKERAKNRIEEKYYHLTSSSTSIKNNTIFIFTTDKIIKLSPWNL